MKHFISQENRIALHKLAKSVVKLTQFETDNGHGELEHLVHYQDLKLAVWDCAVEVTKQHRLIAVTTHEFETIKRCVPDRVVLLRSAPSKLDAA